MIVDATITIGNIIEICTIAGGGLLALGTIRNKVATLTSVMDTMKADFTDMKKEIKMVGVVLTKMESADRRITNVEADIRELRHGQGFVQSIQGEWPRRGE